jgi:hypothetical protein
MAMNQLRSELEPGVPAVRGQAVAIGGPALSGARVDRLLGEPVAQPEASRSSPPPMYGICLGAVAGIGIWLALVITYLFF